MTAVLDTALALAGSGRAVFPINASKKPLTPRGFHDASRDPAVIRAWFKRDPDAGLAAPMGAASGLWCLDVDGEKVNPATGEVTAGGEEALAALVDRYGPLPPTLEQRTGSGKGRQQFFRWTPGLQVLSRTGDIAPGLDTRGANPDGQATGYCALPPSGHYTGWRYIWTNPSGEAVPDFSAALAPPWLLFRAMFSRRDRDALAAIGITGPEGFGGLAEAEWPARAEQLLAEAEAARAGGTADAFERPADGAADGIEHYARRAIEAELAALAATAPGAQDVEMNNAAIRLWSLLKGAGLEGDAGTVRELFLDACRRLSHQPGRGTCRRLAGSGQVAPNPLATAVAPVSMVLEVLAQAMPIRPMAAGRGRCPT